MRAPQRERKAGSVSVRSERVRAPQRERKAGSVDAPVISAPTPRRGPRVRRRAAPPYVQDGLFDIRLRPEQRYYRQMLAALARSGFSDADHHAGTHAGPDAAMAAEVTISALLGTVWAAQPVPRDGGEEEAFGLGLVDYVRQHPAPTALAVLRVLEVVAPIREVRVAAASAAADQASRGVPEPHWSRPPGSPSTGRCWAYDDVFGDQTTMISEFLHGPDRHAVILQIDRSRFSTAADATLLDTADAVDSLLRALRTHGRSEESMFALRQVDPAWARALQLRAMARTDLIEDLPTWPGYARLRALTLARIASLPDAGATLEPDADPPGPAARSELVAEFLASPQAAALSDPQFVAAVAATLVDYGCAHDPARVTRVSPATWDTFLFDWWPRHRVHGGGPAEVLRAWSAWSSARMSLPDNARADLAADLDDALEEVFAHR